MRILEVSGGYQMATRDRFAEFILRLGARKKRPALTGATLETLAIIGYLQPVIRASVESIRGVESSGTIRNLLDLGLIEVVGHKEVIGRPPMYDSAPTPTARGRARRS
jgi:segregation and condensation protein B